MEPIWEFVAGTCEAYLYDRFPLGRSRDPFLTPVNRRQADTTRLHSSEHYYYHTFCVSKQENISTAHYYESFQ